MITITKQKSTEVFGLQNYDVRGLQDKGELTSFLSKVIDIIESGTFITSPNRITLTIAIDIKNTEKLYDIEREHNIEIGDGAYVADETYNPDKEGWEKSESNWLQRRLI